MTSENPFPDGTGVQVRYPLSDTQPYRQWPWLPGKITARCGLAEWHVTVLADGLASGGTFPSCRRTVPEIRVRAA